MSFAVVTGEQAAYRRQGFRLVVPARRLAAGAQQMPRCRGEGRIDLACDFQGIDSLVQSLQPQQALAAQGVKDRGARQRGEAAFGDIQGLPRRFAQAQLGKVDVGVRLAWRGSHQVAQQGGGLADAPTPAQGLRQGDADVRRQSGGVQGAAQQSLGKDEFPRVESEPSLGEQRGSEVRSQTQNRMQQFARLCPVAAP